MVWVKIPQKNSCKCPVVSLKIPNTHLSQFTSEKTLGLNQSLVVRRECLENCLTVFIIRMEIPHVHLDKRGLTQCWEWLNVRNMEVS